MSDDSVGDHVKLDGTGLSIETLVRIARDPSVRVECDEEAIDNHVKPSRAEIDGIVADYKTALDNDGTPTQEYGITTGFGEFKTKPVRPADLDELQENIILSHSVGVGENSNATDPANYFPPEVVRATLAIRLDTFLQGHSGVSVRLVRCIEGMLNAAVVPLVPIRGSVGASGDLCPLAHLFSVLVPDRPSRSDDGQSRRDFYLVRSAEGLTQAESFAAAMPRHRLAEFVPAVEGFRLGPKEGLALTNGATFSLALLALAVADAERLADAADTAVAMSMEAVCGCARAYDRHVHEARGMAGQIASAALVRQLLVCSRLIDAAAAEVQDVYSIRCAPQVHGASRDSIAYAKGIVEKELAAATDNPLFFPKRHTSAKGGDDDPFDWNFSENWPKEPSPYDGRSRISYSAGNFHGEPIALAADFLAIGVAELASVSERRTQMLLDGNMNRNLPQNLIPRRGVNSGFMIAQYCAAGLVSENKVLAHPASVDSIPTSANSEDHVSMATIAARKLRTVVANTRAVLAIELLAAAQGIEWRIAMGEHGKIRALKPVPESLLPEDWQGAWERDADEDARFKEQLDPNDPGKRQAIAAFLGRGTRQAYLAVREAADPMLLDRMLDGDIRAICRVIESGAFTGLFARRA